jgi:hypothetical protein
VIDHDAVHVKIPSKGSPLCPNQELVAKRDFATCTFFEFAIDVTVGHARRFAKQKLGPRRLQDASPT